MLQHLRHQQNKQSVTGTLPVTPDQTLGHNRMYEGQLGASVS